MSALKCGLLPLCEEALVLGQVSYHECEGIVTSLDEQPRIARDLGPTNKVLQHSHILDFHQVLMY